MNEIIAALKQAMDEPVVNVKNYRTGRYPASSFGWCLRKTYFRRTAKSGMERMYLDNALKMGVGEGLHQVLQDKLGRIFPDSVIEITIPKLRVTPAEAMKYTGEATFTSPVEVSGRADLLLVLPDGRSGVFEVKSGKPELLQEASPKWSHRLQNGVYWRGLPAVEVYGYIYFDRTSFRYRIHEEKEPEAMWREVLRLINIVEKHVKSGTVPDLETDKCLKICKSCEYCRDCFGR